MSPAALRAPTPPPEHLASEPLRPRKAPWQVLVALPLRALALTLYALATCWTWPLYGLGWARWGRPPILPTPAELTRFLRLVWAAAPSAPPLHPATRAWVSLSLVQLALSSPLRGLAWFLDDVLYGRELAAHPVVAPLFVMSAARSGSTQIARYLEDDPRVVAPTVLQQMFPFLWLWRLVPRTLGRVITEAQVRGFFERAFPKEFLERHEGDPFRADTFDAALLTPHPQHLAILLGPEALADEMGMGVASADNAGVWEHDLVALIDRIGRMTLAHHGGGRRLFLKGHFLAGGDALARRYPDACFVTVVRAAAPRIQSAINYLAANPMDPMVGPVPWAWIGPGVAASEVRYCRAEQAWFGRPEGPRRCAIGFRAFTRDLRGTMAEVYRVAFGDTALPPHVPAEHPERRRTGYLLDRSLADTGVDAAALAAATAPFDAWVQALDKLTPGAAPGSR